MTTDEQINTLRSVIAQCEAHLEELTERIGALAVVVAKAKERLEKLEGYSDPESSVSNMPDYVHHDDLLTTGDISQHMNGIIKAIRQLSQRLEKLERAQTEELVGSVDGVDAELRVKVQAPEEHAWIKMQRWGKATQTPVPLWTTGGRNGTSGTA